MTVHQMHIGVNQGTQQVAANRNRKYFPEEIDWVLNWVSERFIQNKLTPRDNGSFEISQLDADALQTIIRSSVILPAYFNSIYYEAYLPYDYQYLLSDGSQTSDLCGKPVPDAVVGTLYVSRLRQTVSSKSASKFNQSMQVRLGGKTVNIPGDLPYGHKFVGFNEKAEVDFLQPWISAQGEFYWEKFGPHHYPSHYLHVSATNPAETPQYTIDGVINTVSGVVTVNTLRHVSTGSWKENRLTPSNLVRSLLQTPFYRTSAQSPISELSGNILKVYRDNSFIVTDVAISYIRKCVPISLSLNCNSELPSSFHQQIVDLAIEYIKNTNQNQPGYGLKREDIATRVTI